MRVSVLAIGTALLVLNCVGCQADDEPGTVAAGDARRAASAVAPATDPCAGVTACREVTRVDVDGDGNPDRVGVSILREPVAPQMAYGQVTIAVRVASGPTVYPIELRSLGNLPGSEAQPTPYVGAYRISRTNASDLVFHTQKGSGNPEEFAVIGWSAGRPSLVVRPPRLNANYRDPAVWYMSSSHGVHEWVTCASAGAAVTIDTLSAPTAEGIPIPGGGIREEDHFTFGSDQWTPAGSSNVADNDFSYDFDPHTQTFQCDDQGKK